MSSPCTVTALAAVAADDRHGGAVAHCRDEGAELYGFYGVLACAAGGACCGGVGAVLTVLAIDGERCITQNCDVGIGKIERAAIIFCIDYIGSALADDINILVRLGVQIQACQLNVAQKDIQRGKVTVFNGDIITPIHSRSV